jgi:hypothetical protein
VVEVDLLRSRVKVRMEDAPETIAVYSNEDIAILRSGKAKKNDPPIPADLAPISGAGKRAKKAEPEESVRLDSIRFRYSEETVAEELAPEEETILEEQEPEEEAGEARKPRRRNHRRSRGGHREEKAEQKPQEKPVAEAPQKQEQEKPAKTGNNHNRRYHHYRRRKSGGAPKQGE